MLKLLRSRKLKKRVFYLLAIIIVPSFVLWGSASVIKDKSSKGSAGYAGKIFGKKVSFEEYMSALHAWRNQLRMRYGNQALQIENLFDVNQATWDKLILLFEAKRMKIKISNNELTSYITSLPFLQRDGVFNSGLYELFLKYSMGTPAKIFEEQTRELLMVQKIFDHITDDITVTEEEIFNRHKQEHEQIKVKYVSVISKDLTGEIALTEQELKDYYEKKLDDFKAPIQINLNYVGIDYPSEATDEQKDGIDEKIKEVYEVISESKDLATAGEKFGLQTKETGFLTLGDPIPYFKLMPQDTIMLFNLKKDEISKSIKTSRGPYIFQLKEKRIDYLPSFEEAKEKVKEKLTEEKSKELAKKKIDDYYSEIMSRKESNPSLNLTQATKALGLSIEETNFFSKNSFPENIASSDEFNEIAFGLKEGEISKVIEVNRAYYIIEKSDFKPIEEEEFKKERDNFKQVLLEEKKNKVFEEYFTKLRAQAHLIDYVSSQQAK